MANDPSSNPMLLDTPGATIIWPSKAKVSHFEFTGYSSQGSSVVVQGTDGKIKWSATGESDLSPVASHKIGWINGLVLSTLDDGLLLVYVE